jgi:protein TonB
MEPNQIKSAHFLDILFDGRNKDYGAYELRKTYNRRITKAMIGTGAMIGLLLLGWSLSGMKKDKAIIPVVAPDFTTVNIKEVDKPMPLPPVHKAAAPLVATTRITTTRIVPDNQVRPDEKPPENDAADNMKIGDHNAAGAADDGIEAPPGQGAVAGVVEAPKKKDDDDGIFIDVQIEASYPGGISAWGRFLHKNFQYPEEALDKQISGTVMVQFIVDKEGNVSNVEVLSGPDQGGLREEALRVIKKSGKWIPAQQNGRYVKSYRRQPVIFIAPQD